MSVEAVIKRDDRVARVLARCANADKDVDAWMDELMTLHASRGIRSLNTTALLSSAQHVSITTNLDNQTVRSRAVEIKMRALRQELFVSEQIDILRKYVLAKYSELLKEAHKTLSDRRSAVDNCLRKAIRSAKRLNGATKVADLVIEDCDAAGFSLRRVNEVLTMKSVDR